MINFFLSKPTENFTNLVESMSGAAAVVAVKHSQSKPHGGAQQETGQTCDRQEGAHESTRCKRQGAQAAVKWLLRVGLIRAQHLPKVDVIGSADPFVTLQVAGQDPQKSSMLKDTLNPEWFEEFDFDVRNEKV